MYYFSNMHCAIIRGAWIRSAHVWWDLLLDVHVLDFKMALLFFLDRWMCAKSLFTPILLYSNRLFADANTIGNIAAFASVDWGCAVQIMAAASIGSGLKFSPTVGYTLYVQLCYYPVCNSVLSDVF